MYTVKDYTQKKMNNKKLIAKVLEVKTKPMNMGDSPDENNFDYYNVLEFENGLIMVEGCTTNDWYFEDRDNIEANGLDIVVSVNETGENKEISVESFLESVEGAKSEWGEDSVPSKYLELI